MFWVGQKIACVNGEYAHPTWRDIPNKPVIGKVYTIREIVSNWYGDGEISFRLVEIDNPPLLWEGGEISEPCFWSERFRPLVKRETDISIFTALLTPSQVDA